jgi:hypothetical protein
MSVVSLVVILLGLAAVLWLVNSKATAALNPTMKAIINIVVITVAIILVLSAFGVWQEIRGIQVPKL